MPLPEYASSWDIVGIRESLHAETEIARSPADGDGVRFFVGLSQLTLDVWPQVGHARITTPDFRVDAYRVYPAVLGQGDIILEGGVATSAPRIWLDSSGAVTIFIPSSSELGEPADYALRKYIEQPEPTIVPLQEAQNKPGCPPGPIHQADPAAAVSEALQPATGAGSESSGKETKEYIKLSGRVGRSPVFWTTRNGVSIAKFPLGVHLDDGHTDWHTVKAWRTLAEKARALEKGQYASVHGYVDEEIRRGDDGKARRERIIRAAAIIPK
jgi:hypothetical protein